MRNAMLALLLLLPAAAPAQEARPNILWITCEDISPNLGCYGDAYAVTPNLDRLAAQGVRYTRAFAPIGVCAPSRSTLIMGTYAPSVGTHPMRSKGTLPDYVKCFPEYLRGAGYYCTNNVKTDYNFNPPRSAWDESSAKAHWRGRKPGQPFFAVFNYTQCHESQIRIGEAEHKKRMAELPESARHDPAKAPVPPYHPDVPEVRKDWARYADMISYTDQLIGARLKELEDDGLAGETIVFYFSDHGAGMPRSKRWLYDSSLRVPFIVRFPDKHKALAPGAAGTTTDRLVTFADFGPTVLSLAGVKVPAHMQGRPFLGAAAGEPREYVHGFRDRMDERTDFLRMVRDRRWKYIRNYMPQRPYAQHVSYMYLMPTMQAWQRLHDQGKLEGPQKVFFGEKPFEELYDTEADPHEIRNLAGDPAQRETLGRLSKELDRWLLEIKDLGFLPEADLRSRFGARAPHEAVRADPSLYPQEKLMAAAALAARRDPESRPKLRELLKDADPAARFWGATGLLGGGDAELVAALADPSPWVRVAAADALGGTEAALEALRKALADPNEWVRHQAVSALDRLGDKAAPLLDDVRRMEKGEYVQRVAEHLLRGK